MLCGLLSCVEKTTTVLSMAMMNGLGETLGNIF